MTVNNTQHVYHEWSRYQWASTDPIPDEGDVPRWHLAQWPGDQGTMRSPVRQDPARMAASQTGISGFAHNPGAAPACLDERDRPHALWRRVR